VSPLKSLRLICARAETITDPLLPQEQAGFRHGRSALDQVTLLTQDIEDSFSAKKAGAVFVDLTAAYDAAAAYDAVWHRGLACKLLRLLPVRHMVHMIMEMVSNPVLPLPPEMAKGAGYHASRTQIPRSKVGQVAHVPPTP